MDKSGRQFVNNARGEFFLSHVALQDAVRFQGYRYEILSGLRYSLRSMTSSAIISDMFKLRRELKRAGNPAQ